MELDLQSLFGLNLHSCNHWLRPPEHPPPPPLSYTRALLVSQDRRHLLVTSGNGSPLISLSFPRQIFETSFQKLVST
jgi:hypothetical protein